VKNTLVAERENLLGLLREYIHSVSSDFGLGQNREYTKLLDMPEVISSIYWVRQLECKVFINILFLAKEQTGSIVTLRNDYLVMTFVVFMAANLKITVTSQKLINIEYLIIMAIVVL
jgi:hypothetical protein